MRTLILVALLVGIVAGHYQWRPYGYGVNGTVHAIALTDMADAYVGGTNLTADGNGTTFSPLLFFNYTSMKWQSTSWFNLVGDVVALTYAPTTKTLYIAGAFTSGASIYTYNAASGLAPLNISVSFSSVNAFQLFDDSLYIVGSVGAATLIRYQLMTGVATIIGSTGGQINAFAVRSHQDIFIGGLFISVNSVNALSVAHYNGSAWSSVDAQLNGVIFAIAVSSNVTYFGGSFTHIDTNQTAYNNVAQYSVTGGWAPLGNGANDRVNSIVYFEEFNVIYAAGRFTSMNNVNKTNLISYWDIKASQWAPLGNGVSNSSYPGSVINVIAREPVEDEGYGTLAVGGDFPFASRNWTTNFARWATHPESPATTAAPTQSRVVDGFVTSSGDLTSSGIVAIVMVASLFVLILCACIILRKHLSSSPFPRQQADQL